MRRFAIATVLAAAALQAAHAATPPQAQQACGFNLGAAIHQKWLALGGERGRFGCPVAHETETPRPESGTIGRGAEFRGPEGDALFVQHASGARTGQVYFVVGCFYNLYKQRGGPGSVLGLPIGDGYDAAGGARQDFEGGYMLWNRPTGQCHTFAPAPAAAPDGPRPAMK